MSEVTRYAVIETALCIGSNLMDGEVFMVMATDHDRELAAFREENKKVQKRYEDMTDLAVEFEGAAESAELGLSLGLQREAALREELTGLQSSCAIDRRHLDRMIEHSDDLQQRLTAAEQRNAVRDIESAAMVLANCMDYPWEHMPENGRILMRKHAKDVVDAALAQPTELGASE